MSKKLKLNFNSKEEEIEFVPETFEELKNLFLELYNEKSLKDINFKYIEEDKEILLNNENYQNLRINENIDTIFISNNLNNNFSNVIVESEYPTEDDKSYNNALTPNPENSTIININMDNPYKTDDKNKIKEIEKSIEQLKNKNLELIKEKKEKNDLIKKYF